MPTLAQQINAIWIVSWHDQFVFLISGRSNSTKAGEPTPEEEKNDYVIIIVIGVSGVAVIILVVVVIVVKKRRKANSRGRRRPKVRYNKPSAGT